MSKMNRYNATEKIILDGRDLFYIEVQANVIGHQICVDEFDIVIRRVRKRRESVSSEESEMGEGTTPTMFHERHFTDLSVAKIFIIRWLGNNNMPQSCCDDFIAAADRALKKITNKIKMK